MRSLRTKITLLCTFMIVATMVVASAYGISAVRDMGYASANETLKRLCETGQKNLDNFVKRLPDIREAGQRLNIAMIDLDDMKDVNDEYGHPAGDAVLRDVAGFLMLNFSQGEDDDGSDVEQYAVRYGGDEFIVLNIGSDPGEFAREVRGRYAEMRRVCYFEDLEIPFSLSIGIATTDELGWDWTHLLEVADQRMYEDKRAKEAAED